MSEELRPCPFCGLHVELVSAKTYPNGERSPAYIKCKRCNYHIAGYEDKDVINQWNTRSAIRKEFCPNCEKDTECIHAAELYECQECGDDFAKYIVPRTAPCTAVNEPSNSDVSMTQDVLTDIKTPRSENNNPDYYKHDAVSWISIATRIQDKVFEIQDLKAELAELRERTRWIPVSERLPEEKQSVLALHRTGTAYHWEYSRSLSNIFVDYYTHWMPLPSVPESEDK